MGDALIGNKADFTMAKSSWGPDEIKTFAETICPEYFELEDED